MSASGAPQLALAAVHHEGHSPSISNPWCCVQLALLTWSVESPAWLSSNGNVTAAALASFRLGMPARAGGDSEPLLPHPQVRPFVNSLHLLGQLCCG